MMVNIRLQPFLPYKNLALTYSYRTGIWLLNIITGHITQAEHLRPLSLVCDVGVLLNLFHPYFLKYLWNVIDDFIDNGGVGCVCYVGGKGFTN